jgi:Na+-transporting NADH:ubiquinone oxidoreductase subunit F
VTELILAAAAVFAGAILLMVAALTLIESKIIKARDCKILVNGDETKALVVPGGRTLLAALSENQIFLPSACGGGGTCAMCKCRVVEGGGEILPTEKTHITRAEARDHLRLACQVKVRNDLSIVVPDEIFSIRKFTCTVVSNANVATFIKELALEIEPGVELDFTAGGYIQIDVPPYKLSFRDFAIEERFRPDWDKYRLWDLVSENDEPVYRAYSMASYPAEKRTIKLNVRIAGPPADKPNVPPGVVSSYIFGLKPGDKVTVSGPYGEFHIKETEKEMVYIGGGAGMAPMRSHIFHLLKTLKSGRKISFWYGARSKREIFYADEFEALARENPNFSFNIALSEPLPEDNWTGPIGFIHQVVHDRYLAKHEEPEEIEYYLCGPPMMLAAVRRMLDSLGVEPESIAYDEF